MDVLIAGCGYVGSATAEILATQGHRVYGLRRNIAALPAHVTGLRADLLTGDGLANMPQVEALIYAVGPDSSSESAYHAAYVLGLQTLLRALQGQSLQRFIYVSSTGVYEQQGGEWLDETTPATPQRMEGQILLQGESIARAAGATVLRLSGIYGPGRTRLIDSVRNGTARCIEGRTHILNHIHRDDCAGIIAHLLKLDAPEPLYLGVDDEPANKNEVLRWLARRLNLPDPQSIPVAAQTSPTRGGWRYYSNARVRSSGYEFRFGTFREGYASLM